MDTGPSVERPAINRLKKVTGAVRRRLGANARVGIGLIATLGIVVGLSGFGLDRIRAFLAAASLLAQTQETRATILTARLQLAETESSIRGWSFSGDTIFLDAYRVARSGLGATVADLKRLEADDPDQQQRMADIESLVARGLVLFDREMTRGDRARNRPSGLLAQTFPIADSLRQQLMAIDQSETARVPRRWEVLRGMAHSTTTVVVGFTLLAAIILVVLLAFLHREFSRRRRSETLYHGVVDSILEGVVVHDASGHVLDCNPSAEAILGLSRREVLSLAEREFRGVRENGESFPRDEHPAITALRTGKPVRDVVMGIARGGSQRWLLINSAPLRDSASSHVVGIVTSFKDITRQREAEAALRTERERLQAFLDDATELVVIVAPDGKVRYTNRAFNEALGAEDVDLRGRPLADSLDGLSREGHKERTRRLIAGEHLRGVSTTFVGPGGRRVETFGSISCRFEHGVPVEFHGVFRDVTTANADRVSLIRAVESAEMANRSKTEFLSNMSHELRTPLNSVIGFAKILLANKTGTIVEKDLAFLGRIRDNGMHLLGLINDILDLSRVESGKIELEKTDVALGTLVDQTLVELQVQGRPVDLVAEYPLNLQPLHTDASRLKQVILNLVTNALKFTAQGRVTVRIVGDAATGRPLALDVIDTGIGIPADRHAMIFNAFQQADSSTARRFGGTGLGLTITRSLCELMGYDVAVASEVGLGSTFRVRFGVPAASEPGTMMRGHSDIVPAAPERSSWLANDSNVLVRS